MLGCVQLRFEDDKISRYSLFNNLHLLVLPGPVRHPLQARVQGGPHEHDESARPEPIYQPNHVDFTKVMMNGSGS